MSKREWTLQGDGAALMNHLDKSILQGSMSATLEDACAYKIGDVRTFLRVYERYSALGSNRVSLSLLLIEHGQALQLAAVTSGGSQAVFFKLNTLGEDAFLEKLEDAVRLWQ